MGKLDSEDQHTYRFLGIQANHLQVAIGKQVNHLQVARHTQANCNKLAGCQLQVHRPKH